MLLWAILIHQKKRIIPKGTIIDQRIKILVSLGLLLIFFKNWLKFKVFIFKNNYSNIITFNSSNSNIIFFLIESLGTDSGFFIPKISKNSFIPLSSDFSLSFL